MASYLMNYGDRYTTHTFGNLFPISSANYLQAELFRERLNEKTYCEAVFDGKKLK